MNFFRLRLLNTMLVLLAGVLLGAIFRDSLRQSTSKPAETPRYQPEYEATEKAQSGDAGTEVTSEPGAEVPAVEEAEEEEPPRATPKPINPRPVRTTPETEAEIEDTGTSKAKSPAPDNFFKDPGAFTGGKVALTLQIIAANKRGQGWRLNFVHSGQDGSIHYLYVDDPGALGPTPDLKVGFYYSVTFECAGDAAEGNKLLALVPTGNKADWATGISAVE